MKRAYLALVAVTLAGTANAQHCPPGPPSFPTGPYDPTKPCNTQQYHQQDANDYTAGGAYISPHGGAAGGLCFGANCGRSEHNGPEGGWAPVVRPNGGANGGVCFGPYC